MKTIRCYLANDTSSRAAGAERLADAWRERPEIQLIRTSSRGAQTRRTDILELVDTDVLEIHPADMEGLHLRDGEIVRLVSARGEALLPAVESERVLPGHLFTSFHFPASTVNSLLSSSADESSKCPEYKVSAVRVESIERDELDPEDEAELRHMRRQLIL